jgi:hypothetical protein
MSFITHVRGGRASDGEGKASKSSLGHASYKLMDATLSASTETGMSRLSLSDADKQARDWFVRTTQDLGCSITIDAMGNTFAVRPGRRDSPPICVGSHLDTQPSGGRYDGILGVLAGVEMLKVLNDNDVETEYPVGVVNWTKYVPCDDLLKLEIYHLR